MKLILIPGLFFMISLITHPVTTDEQGVKDAVFKLFEGMEKSDGDMIRNAFHTDAVLKTVVVQDGEARLNETPIENFAQSVGSTEPGFLKEVINEITVHIDGHLATAWMTYDFYAGGNHSHCGVNSMKLIKTSAGWKIFSITDTRNRTGC